MGRAVVTADGLCVGVNEGRRVGLIVLAAVGSLEGWRLKNRAFNMEEQLVGE